MATAQAQPSPRTSAPAPVPIPKVLNEKYLDLILTRPPGALSSKRNIFVKLKHHARTRADFHGW
jgi:hypothetical protein